jgi:hypothetical protein
VPNPVTPPGTSTLTIGNTTAAVPTGSYPMTITAPPAPSPHRQLDARRRQRARSPPTLVSATAAVSTVPTLTWNAAPGAASYLVQVDNDAGLQSGFSATVTTTSVVATGLVADVTYFGGCAPTTSAATTLRWCSTPHRPGLLQRAQPGDPDNNPTSVTSDIVIADPGSPDDLDVEITATHTYVSPRFQLTRRHRHQRGVLRPPRRAGDPVRLLGNNVDVIANDEGPDGNIETQCASLPAIFGNRGGDPPSTTLFAGFVPVARRHLANHRLRPRQRHRQPGRVVPAADARARHRADQDGRHRQRLRATDTITVPSGTSVYYCYHVENTGVVGLNFHDLLDDQLGQLLDNEPISLPPPLRYIVSDVANATVTNTATWTAPTAPAATPWTTHPFASRTSRAPAPRFAHRRLGQPAAADGLPSASDVNYTDAYVSSNGFLTMLAGQSNGCCTASRSRPRQPRRHHLGLVGDLNRASAAPSTARRRAAPNRRFIVRFTNVPTSAAATASPCSGSSSIPTSSRSTRRRLDGGQHSAGVENEPAPSASSTSWAYRPDHPARRPVHPGRAGDGVEHRQRDGEHRRSRHQRHPGQPVVHPRSGPDRHPAAVDPERRRRRPALDDRRGAAGAPDAAGQHPGRQPRRQVPGLGGRGSQRLPARPAATGELVVYGVNDAYGWNSQNGPYYTVFDITVPGVLPVTAPFPGTGQFIGAGEYVDGLVYMIDVANNMWEIDPPTGAILRTFTATAPPGGETYSGMALDPTSGTVYAGSTSVASSTLFTIDVATGTPIGPITNCLA